MGVIAPGGKARIKVELALDLDNDQPFVVSWPTRAGLTFDEISEKLVVIVNPTTKPVAYALFFTRRKWLAAATVDWRGLIARVREMRRRT